MECLKINQERKHTHNFHQKLPWGRGGFFFFFFLEKKLLRKEKEK